MKDALKRSVVAAIGAVCALAVVAGFASAASASGAVAINEQNFPDASFRRFVQDNFDKSPRDGALSDEEIAAVETISLYPDYTYYNLVGIEYFKNLTKLSWDRSEVAELDLSKNTKLREISLPHSPLKDLDISGCTDLRTVNLLFNSLTKLDFSNNTKVTSIVVEEGNISELNINGLTLLQTLKVYHNKLETIDLSTNKALTFLDVGRNKLTGVDIRNNRLLQTLFIDNNEIELIDISYNANLVNRYENGTVINSHGGSGDYHGFISYVLNGSTFALNADTKVYCGIKIDEVNFPDSSARYYLKNKIDKNENGWLSADELESVKEININQSFIEDFSWISLFTNLEKLCLYYCDMETLDLSHNTALKEVHLEDNHTLKNLDISNLTELTKLTVFQCSLKAIDVSQSTKLTDLCLENNDLKELDVSKNTELTTLRFYKNDIKEMDFSKNTKLTWLDCSGNPLGKINVSKNTELIKLECFADQLTEIDLSKNTKLKHLDAHANALTDIDLSKNKAIEGILLDFNELGTLDLSLNENLKELCTIFNDIDVIYVAREGIDITKNNATIVIVVKPSDWLFEGVEWAGNDKNGYTAAANYSYTSYKGDRLEASIDMTVSKRVTPATCTKPGETLYSAAVAGDRTRDGKARTESKSVVIPAKGHDWTEPTYDWSADCSEVTAFRICASDIRHVEKETVRTTSSVIKAATATTSGLIKYTTKTFSNGAFKVQTKTLEIPATGSGTATVTKTPTAAGTKVTLTLDKKEVNIICGKTCKLNATLKGSTAKITWKSSDPAIASVDSSGKVTARMAGTVTITAAAAGKSVKCTVMALYKDVTNPDDFWFTPTYSMTAAGVVKGYENQTVFKPANVCTRAQMVTFIWRLMGSPKPKTSTCKFSDVKKTDYFYEACIWGSEKGIVEGYKDGTFGPQINCARRHAVTFLWRLAGKPAPDSNKNPFKDVKKSDYFYQATLWASGKGILAGYDDGSFRPDGECLRRQLVTFLYKFDKSVKH